MRTLRDFRRGMLQKGYRAHKWQETDFGFQCKDCEFFAINPPFSSESIDLLDGLCGRSLRFESDPAVVNQPQIPSGRRIRKVRYYEPANTLQSY